MRTSILVRNEAESREVQLFAHLMGYVWCSEEVTGRFRFVHFLTPGTIFVRNGRMSYDYQNPDAISYKEFFKLREVS